MNEFEGPCLDLSKQFFVYIVEDPKDQTCPFNGYDEDVALFGSVNEKKSFVFHGTRSKLCASIERDGWNPIRKCYNYESLVALCSLCDSVGLGLASRHRYNLAYTMDRYLRGEDWTSLTTLYTKARDYATRAPEALTEAAGLCDDIVAVLSDETRLGAHISQLNEEVSKRGSIVLPSFPDKSRLVGPDIVGEICARLRAKDERERSLAEALNLQS